MATASSSPAAFPSDIVDAFEDAQRRTIDLIRRASVRLEAGMTERDVVDLVEGMAEGDGFADWFRPPYCHIGSPEKPSFLPSGRGGLRKGDIIEIDACPATPDAYGVFGTALVFGGGPEPALLADAREACRAACGFSSRWKCTGEVYVYAQAWANNRRYGLDSESVGHVCFPRLGRTAMAWPHAARAATLMRRHRIQWFNYRRMQGFYAVQPRITADGRGCAFQEMILIDGDARHVVGRPGGLEDVGTL